MNGTNTEQPLRVVVGVDGSRQSKQALRWAAQIATSTGARIEAVAAWDIPANFGWAAWPAEWNPEGDTEKLLTSTVDEVFGPERPNDIQLIVRRGGAAKVLIDQAEHALMLVVGSRGHGGFTGLLLGSVSSNVAEHAPCAVLVVHGETNLPEVSA
jgi:nucleotide-binding universal stress UspA family protein